MSRPTTPARSYFAGMGQAVADRTVNRKIVREFKKPKKIKFLIPRDDKVSLDEQMAAYVKSQGYLFAGDYHVAKGDGVAVSGHFMATGKRETETWEDVADRVSVGNALLGPKNDDAAHLMHGTTLSSSQRVEFQRMRHHLRQASLLMSGRHLQHGDITQPTRNMEVFTNCSTAASTFLLFYLLLNGSGVGRAYDDAMIKADLNQMPIVVCTIGWNHGDVASGIIQGYPQRRDVEHMYADRPITVFDVPDSREGWAKAFEVIERMAFERRRDEVLVLDFTGVRERGKPIMGMQGRPASGPGPLMGAIAQIAKLRDAGMAPWRAALFADHYAAECVLVGGARRAARMATKHWKDPTIFDFIKVKRGGFLWSSNNSVTVDQEFRQGVKRVQEALKWEAKAETGPIGNRLQYMFLKGKVSADDKHAYQVLMAIARAAYDDKTGEPGIINQDRLTQNTEGLADYLDGLYAESAKFKLDGETLPLMRELTKAAIDSGHAFITNPCVTADTWIQTSDGPRQVSELIDKPFTAVVDGRSHAATGFWKTGDKQVFRIKTDRGYEVRATDNHKFLVEVSRRRGFGAGSADNVETDWVELKDLEPGDKLILSAQVGITSWGNENRYQEGWLLGLMVGDGGYNPSRYPGYVRFWGEERRKLAQEAQNIVRMLPYSEHRPVQLGETPPADNQYNGTSTVASRALDQLAEGLISPFDKNILPALERKDGDFCRGFLRGLFDADGSVQGSTEKGVSVRLGQSNLGNIKVVQRMLSRHGIVSTIYENRREAHSKELPDGHGSSKIYDCRAQHELVISKDNVERYRNLIGFRNKEKVAKLVEALRNRKRPLYKERFTAEITEIVAEGIEAVYDCTVDEVHRFDANGIVAHNCGEIVLFQLGGYCVIADVVPFHAGGDVWRSWSYRFSQAGSYSKWQEEYETDAARWDVDAEDAFRTATRALIRTNLMDSLYKREVTRTNRIGVGITGFHEWAYARFGFTWHDLVDEEKSMPLWQTMSRFKRAIVDEAARYSAELGVVTPHTNTTFKPAGTTSKLFGLTEGAHLPSMREFIRWVQFRNDDPLVKEYEEKGFPIKRLKQYDGTTVVGFPTKPAICELDGGSWVVTAAEATPEAQYQFLRLLEKYWLTGVEEDGVTPLAETGNQVSYTLKYDPNRVSFERFLETLIEGQFSIRACSVMPQTDTTAYEYQPEQPVTKAEFEHIAAAIAGDDMKEDIGLEHVDCSTGACPISFNENEAAA